MLTGNDMITMSDGERINHLERETKRLQQALKRMERERKLTVRSIRFC